MMELTDTELIESFQKGNQRAFEMIFERYKTKLFNFSLRILNNRAEAEDVTSDVFLALLTERYTINPQVKFSTWAYAVARNSCISRIRKAKRATSIWITNTQGKTEEMPVADTAESHREKLAQQEIAQLIQQAIHKLPLEQKEALILREYHHLNYSDIAQILHCSLEKIKVLIFRAREQLRVELSSFVKEENL